VFKLRSLDAESVVLRLRGFELSLGLGYGFLGVDAGFIESLGQIERLLVSDDGGIQQLFQRILPAQLKVVGRHFGLDREACVLEIGGAGLGARGRRFHSVADSSEQVRLPGGIKGSEYSVKVPDEDDLEPDPELDAEEGDRWTVMDGLVVTVGKAGRGPA